MLAVISCKELYAAFPLPMPLPRPPPRPLPRPLPKPLPNQSGLRVSHCDNKALPLGDIEYVDSAMLDIENNLQTFRRPGVSGPLLDGKKNCPSRDRRAKLGALSMETVRATSDLSGEAPPNPPGDTPLPNNLDMGDEDCGEPNILSNRLTGTWGSSL